MPTSTHIKIKKHQSPLSIPNCPPTKKYIYMYTTCVEINVLHSFRAFLGGVNVFLVTWEYTQPPGVPIIQVQALGLHSSPVQPWARPRGTIYGCFLQIGGVSPKMDGENNGKVY